MLVNLTLDKKDKGVSLWQPNEKELKTVQMILDDWNHGKQIMDKPRREFNDKTLVERMTEDQLSFNSYQEAKSEDPTEAWRSRAVRPIVRNKVISIAAHITQNLIYPNIFAQNENDEIDKDAAQIMRLLMEYVAEESEYEKNFLYSVIGALVNPATILHLEYSEIIRKVKKITEKDKWEWEEVIDELYSGFKQAIVPVDELYIENFYEHDIQKQGFLLWRKPISKYEAEIKYGKCKNFEYVKPGFQTMFDGEGGDFYEQYDEELQGSLVEEVIYYNRFKDLQLVLLNGVLVKEHDTPMQREDKKYPFAKTGYELIDEGRCFYYRSLAYKLHNDEEVVNTLYRMITDGTYLNLMPPGILYGNEDADTSIMMPGAITAFSANSRLESLKLGNDFTAGFNMLNKVESSITESSASDLASGTSPQGTQTAFEISRVEQNARIMLGLYGKMIGFFVKDIGQLMIGDILQYCTIGDVQELSDGNMMMKFSKYTLTDKNIDGKNQDITIEFDNEMDDEMTDEDYEKESFGLLKKEGGLESKKNIKKVNPKLFRNLKYKVKVTPDIVNPPSDNVQRALNLEVYDRAIQNPITNQEALTRDLLFGSYSKTKNDTDKYIKQQEAGGELQNLVAGKTGSAMSPLNAVANAEAMKI